ncbi:TauD/TfdA family dioxygenase (plasmid) [Streptomyces sp. NBC_01527]|uniref:TauD/TfdA family dioxygenase n=1 Tax=unclassified Streptomyces TaxID=2593676 RepID=UPI002E0FFD5F|nr:TauD/TfdA family dioxygenase [Streptomyces sp. NBC_01230]
MPPDPAQGFRVIRGLFDGLEDVGPTPAHWSKDDPQRTASFDVTLALVAETLGSVFGWADQQDGRLVHNILPSKGFEDMQVGASSIVPLAWHTEDGFHPERADFLLLACVRNPDGIGSRLASIRDVVLDPADIAQLRQPLLTIEPDDSYGDHAAATMEPVGMATLWDSPDGLCVRYDPSYTRYLTDEKALVRAHERLGEAFEEHGSIVSLSPGDLLIIDNNVMVHGRVSFRPRYDGTDRWLKRVLVRARRSRAASESHEHGFSQERVFPGLPAHQLVTGASSGESRQARSDG